ncbi:MAG: ABC transporter permease [Acidobacteria bacterium]|nr:ABC transporter permease [Acidobacteriota bacterium]
MAGLGNDVRYALRTLVRNPGFAITAALVLALGIAANSVTFSFVNSFFLRSLPVDQPERIVRIYTTYEHGPRYFTVSYPDYQDAADLDEIFSGVLADRPAPLHLSAGGRHERIWAYIVSANYFSVLGVQPALGRFFRPGEADVPGRQPVVVLSHGFWQRRFGGDRGILGVTIALNGHPFTVIGIAPEGFHGVNVGLRAELWVPAMMEGQLSPGFRSLEHRGARGYFVIGRLRPEVEIDRARAAVEVLAARLQQAYPSSNRGISFTVLPEAESGLHPMVRRGFLGFAVALALVMSLVLLLACTNVAGLLLARAASRRSEIAVRLALGASRARIVRQLLTESTILWLIAGGIGVSIAAATVRVLGSVELPTDRPLFINVGMDVRVLGFSILATVLTGTVFGLAPALSGSKADVMGALRQSGGRPGFRSPLRRAMVAGQVALCLVLLIGAGLCLRSLFNAQQIDLGFDPGGVAMASIDLATQGYEKEKSRRFLRDLEARISNLPGVESVGLANRIPFELNIIRTSVGPVGENAPRLPSVDWATVDRGYFQTLRMPLREGRVFSDLDTEQAASVVVINETLVRRFWPNRTAVGRHLRVSGTTREVIGVVKDGKYLTLGEEPTGFVYVPFEQEGGASMTLVVRGAGHPAAVLARVRQQVSAMDETLPLYNVRTMQEHLAIAMVPVGASAALLGFFGALALLLASVGLYGMLAFAVTQRTHEIGIRRALGAANFDVIGLVTGQAMSPVLFGVLAGMALALLTSPVLRSLLYGIGPTDPIAYGTAATVLLFTAGVACWVPASRAIRIEPAAALRQE